MRLYADREIMEGFLPWRGDTADPNQVILVRANHRSAEVLTGDTPEPMSAFLISEALYSGEDRRGIPTVDFDDDLSKYL